MINKHNQVICDQTKIILEDGVTLVPNYISIENGKLTAYGSNDPLNEAYYSRDRKKGFKNGMLHDRVEYKYKMYEEENNNELLQGKHFVSRSKLEQYLASSVLDIP